MGRKPPKPETVTAYKEFQKEIARLQGKYKIKAVNDYGKS